MLVNKSGGVSRSGTLWYSTTSPSGDEDDQPSHDNGEPKNVELDEGFDDLVGGRPELELQGVDPKRGWGFRGVHKVLDVVN